MTAEERIFSIVRGGLYAKLPSLALPLGRLTCREGDVDPAGTDGEAAVFAPGLLRREFLAESDLPERLTLHLLLHLMLGHPWGRQGRARALWDTACDLAVGLVRHALLPQEPETPAAFSARCKLQARRAVRAPAIYALLLEQPDALTAEEQAAFYLDDHRLWQLSASASAPKTADGGAETGWQALGRKLPAAEAGTPPSLCARMRAAAGPLRRCCANAPRCGKTAMSPATNFSTRGISTVWSTTAACRSSSRWNIRRSAACVSLPL